MTIHRLCPKCGALGPKVGLCPDCQLADNRHRNQKRKDSGRGTVAWNRLRPPRSAETATRTGAAARRGRSAR